MRRSRSSGNPRRPGGGSGPSHPGECPGAAAQHDRGRPGKRRPPIPFQALERDVRYRQAGGTPRPGGRKGGARLVRRGQTGCTLDVTRNGLGRSDRRATVRTIGARIPDPDPWVDEVRADGASGCARHRLDRGGRRSSRGGLTGSGRRRRHARHHTDPGASSPGGRVAAPVGYAPPREFRTAAPVGGAGDATHRTAPGTQKSWRRPIFPKGCPLSIFGAGELNFRVRDGNGCGLSASVTRISASDDAIDTRPLRPHTGSA